MLPQSTYELLILLERLEFLQSKITDLGGDNTLAEAIEYVNQELIESDDYCHDCEGKGTVTVGEYDNVEAVGCHCQTWQKLKTFASH